MRQRPGGPGLICTPEFATAKVSINYGRSSTDASKQSPFTEPPDIAPAMIGDGQWATLSLDYARTHAMNPEDPEQDWPILTTQAPADHIFTTGNDLNEFGFVGPSISTTIIQQFRPRRPTK